MTRATTFDAASGRSLVDRAAAALTARDASFATALSGAVAGRPRIAGDLAGRRRGTTSTASVRWRGSARFALPSARLRIVRDQLQVALGRKPFRTAGRASGVQLDVGRELLLHPFLLTTDSARRRGSEVWVSMHAQPSTIRRFAATQRRGPVAQLIGATRTLTFVAHLQRQRLIGDQFRLDTTIPTAGFPAALGGRRAVISGVSAYC